jgi:hypothetical protein
MVDIVLPAGLAYFDIEDASGDLTGERYLAESRQTALSVESQNLEVFGSDTPIAEKILDVATQVARSFALTLEDMAIDNLALFVIGDASTLSQSSGSETAEVHDAVTQGRYYQLGASTSNPTGAREVSSVVVKDDGSTTFTVTDDYTVDTVLGRVYVVPGGAITDGTNLRIDYDTAAKDREHIVSSSLGAKRGALRIIADNTEGSNRDIYIPKVQLRPNGATEFTSRDTVQQVQFEVSVSKRTGYEQLYVDGRAV